MALPLSGHKVHTLLSIETEDFVLVIKGPAKNKIVEAFKLHQDEHGEMKRAVLRVSSGSASIKVFDPQLGLVDYKGGTIWPCFFEQTNYEFILEKKAGCQKQLAVDHLNKQIRDAITSLGEGDRLLTGILNFGDEVGFSHFEIVGDNEVLFSFELEVFPSKLDYQRDFEQLLREVNEEVYNLAYDFLLKTRLYAELRDEKATTQAEFYAIFNAIQEKLFQALERVMKRPHHKIVSVSSAVHPARAKHVGKAAVRWLQKRSKLFERDKYGLVQLAGEYYTPRRILDTRKELSYNTYENRFLKWMLWQINFKLKAFKEKYLSQKNVDERVIAEITRAQKQLQRYARFGFLQEVGKLTQVEHSSLVMQMAPGYRQVFKCYLMLLKGLNISSDLFAISPKGLAALYEYWCFLKINALLRKKYRLERNDLVKVESNGITVNLVKGKASTLEYVNPHNGEKYTLTYNRRYSDLPTIAQTPDNVLKLEKEGSETEFHYIFDAKYRLAVEDEYIKRFKQPGPPEDAINTMHRYRDAIITQENISRNVFAAIVLFPYNDELRYAGQKGEPAHKFYESIEQVGIGALPFLPDQTKLVETLLEQLILETPDSAFERTVMQEGTVEYLTRDSKRNVLIGPLGRKDQLDLCLKNNYYYTYLKEVKSYLNELEYVAIYQSKRLFTNEAEQGIYYYGRIKDYTVLYRYEIKEAPRGRAPHELAVLFTIERWEKRLNPIRPGGYGPAEPQRTSWEIFKEANLYPELHLSSIEVRLWRELRRFKECIGVDFSAERIAESDHMTSMEFPGLFVKRINENEFQVITGTNKRIFCFNDLNVRPAKVLRDIIKFWRKNLGTPDRNCIPWGKGGRG